MHHDDDIRPRTAPDSSPQGPTGGCRPENPTMLQDKQPPIIDIVMFLVALLLSCTALSPSNPTTDNASPAPADGRPAVTERWEPVDTGSLCLIFHDSGALTMALTGRSAQGKIEITADHERTDTALHVVPRRILQNGYVSRCRQSVVPDRYLDEQDVLGLRLAPGETTTFALRTLSSDRLEICGLPEHCIQLRRVDL